MTQLSWKTANGKYNHQIISGDGVGYYQYLVNYFHNETIQNQEQNTDFMMEFEGRIVNKCFAGAAICMAPFYKIAEFHSFIVNESFDPYSPRTKKWINAGSLFYLFVAFGFLYKWLKLLKLKDSSIFWSIVAISLGSNLFLYSVLSPSMTHVYSFFAVSGFLLFTFRFFQSEERRWFYYASFFLGLVVTIRPINGIIILLLPLLAGSLSQLLHVIKRIRAKNWVLGLLLGFVFVFMQLYLWFIQTGHWIVWSYGEEGFYWSNPQIVEVLFGFRKGWFVYTPIALVSLFALPFVFKKSKEQFFSVLLFFIVLIYVVSSWWNWYYGSSFGQRSFVDFYAVITFLLATLLHKIQPNKLLNILVKVFIVGLVGLNIFQSFQYKENIISSWDMSSKKYVATFGVGKADEVIIGGSRAILPYNSQKEQLLDTSYNFKSASAMQSVSHYFDYSTKEYGVALKYPLETCSNLSRGYYIEVEISRLELELNSSEHARMIIEMKDEQGGTTYYTWFFINEVPAKIKDQWTNYSYQLLLPKCDSDNSQLAVYIRNEEKANFLISRFDLKVFDLY